MHALGVLFCRPMYRHSGVDDPFTRDADIVEWMELDVHCAAAELIVEEEAERALEHLPEGRGRSLLYRGVILSAEQYEGLYEAAMDRGYTLVTDPAQYERALYLPEYYPVYADVSPRTRWTYSDSLDEAWEAALELGPPPWLIKDHIKSAKEHWLEACYVPEGAGREDFDRIASRLLELHADRFARGFVIREFLQLAATGARTAARRIPDEHRLFFWQGQLVAHAPYLDYGEPLTDTAPFEALGRRVDSPFFTVDIAFLQAGGWIVVELNDGGISGLPEQLDERELYGAIFGMPRDDYR